MSSLKETAPPTPTGVNTSALQTASIPGSSAAAVVQPENVVDSSTPPQPKLSFPDDHGRQLVYLDMDQQQLDDSYNQVVYAPNLMQIVGRYASTSAALRLQLGEPKRVSYGDSESERFDFYAASSEPAPVCLFLHGGAWRQDEAKDYAFPAELFLGAGVHFAAVDFDNVITTGGDLIPMADQVRRAIAFVYRNAASFGGNPNRIFIVGHSSGAHLAAVALTTDWGALGLPSDVIKAGVVCSGIFDLVPVSLSARRGYVNFTPHMIESLSPIRHVDRLFCPVLIAYGTHDTPEFQRQSTKFANTATQAAKNVELLVGDGYNHFELIETLGNPYGPLGRAALKLMRSVL